MSMVHGIVAACVADKAEQRAGTEGVDTAGGKVDL